MSEPEKQPMPTPEPAMTAGQEEIIDKIKKLLTRAETSKGSTQAEAESALMMAQRLALKHGIDLASVDMTEDTSAGEPIIQQPFRPTREGGGLCAARLPSCHKFITWILKSYFGVKVIECTNWEKYEDKGKKMEGAVKSLSIIGRQTNVHIAIYVYGFLHREFMDLWHKHRKVIDAPMSSRNSFFYGLYQGLSEKLEVEKGKVEAEAQAELESKGNKEVQMILIGEKEKVEQAVKGFHPRLRYFKVSEGNVEDHGSLYEGRRAGKKIKIHTAIK
jgi:pyruvate carboxylase